MTRLAAWASLLSLLMVGVLIGGLAVHIYHGRTGPHDGFPPRAGDGDRRHGRPLLIDRLAEELELSDAQREEIRGLMEQARTEGERMRREMRPRLMEQMRVTHERILAVLDEGQRARFEALAPDPEALAGDLFRGRPGGRREHGPRRLDREARRPGG